MNQTSRLPRWVENYLNSETPSVVIRDLMSRRWLTTCDWSCLGANRSTILLRFWEPHGPKDRTQPRQGWTGHQKNHHGQHNGGQDCLSEGSWQAGKMDQPKAHYVHQNKCQVLSLEQTSPMQLCTLEVTCLERSFEEKNLGNPDGQQV